MLQKLQFDYKKYLKILLEYASTYRLALTALAIGGIFAFSIVRISSLSDPELDQVRLQNQTTALKKVRFDETAIDNIQSLVDSGIEIDALFDPNRDENPFTR